MAATLDMAVEQIKQIRQDARIRGNSARPRWPMIVLKSPKGWTGPKSVDGSDSRYGGGADQTNPARRTHPWQLGASALADDRTQITQRLDWAEERRWQRL